MKFPQRNQGQSGMVPRCFPEERRTPSEDGEAVGSSHGRAGQEADA